MIVGGQSTGKSSLLQSLTDFPFPVGADCCTRFATRIVSRRTPPGTPNQVKITIVPPVSKEDGLKSDSDYVCVMESLTSTEFSNIVEEVCTAIRYSCRIVRLGNTDSTY